MLTPPGRRKDCQENHRTTATQTEANDVDQKHALLGARTDFD
jgi:hypothetical protein